MGLYAGRADNDYRMMTAIKHIFFRTRYFMVYGLVMAALVFVLKWLQWRFLIVDNALDIYVGMIAVFFTAIGIWVASQLSKPRVETVVVEKEVFVPSPDQPGIDEGALSALALTSREYEVLQLMAAGNSNTEIAASLFLSVSTVKTHASNLFVKMEVRSRTQAVGKAKRLRIIL